MYYTLQDRVDTCLGLVGSSYTVYLLMPCMHFSLAVYSSDLLLINSNVISVLTSPITKYLLFCQPMHSYQTPAVLMQRLPLTLGSRQKYKCKKYTLGLYLGNSMSNYSVSLDKSMDFYILYDYLRRSSRLVSCLQNQSRICYSGFVDRNDFKFESKPCDWPVDEKYFYLRNIIYLMMCSADGVSLLSSTATTSLKR